MSKKNRAVNTRNSGGKVFGHGATDVKALGPQKGNDRGPKKTMVSTRPADSDKFDEHRHPKKASKDSSVGFTEAISESQRQAAAKDARELRAHLSKNGVPSPRELGRRFQLRQLFHEMKGDEFDRILQESSKT